MTEPPRFNWIRTWPDDPQTPDDWRVPQDQLVEPTDVLRIFKVRGGPHGDTWCWTAARIRPGRPTNISGYEATAKLARESAERAYLS